MRRKNSCVGAGENFPTPEEADCWDSVWGCWFELKVRLWAEGAVAPCSPHPHRVTSLQSSHFFWAVTTSLKM